MKTSNAIPRKMKSAITGLTLIMSAALLITSCQKEEMEQPVSGSNTSEMSDMNALTKPAPVLAFSSIKIDHIAALSLFADYSVTINSNGTGTYEGRGNVHIKGTRTFEIKRTTLLYINSVCMAVNFFDLKGGVNYIPDMPGVETTYSLLEHKKSLSDYEGQPQELVSFRTKIENALDLSKFINAPAGTAVASDEK